MKVSVVVVTYNHAPYIDTALRSVCDQEVDFDVEILVSEDASTDGTREIVQAWQERHSDRIRLILSSTNVRTNQVVARAMMAARGEYVALLDGDDYWTSPQKLQRQVQILEADPGLGLCFTNAEIVGDGEGASGKLWTSPALKSRLTIDDLWQGNPFATCGSLFRRACVPVIPQWYDDFFPITDWPLYVLFAEHGNIAYLPEAMGAYRLHSGGLYSAQSQQAKLASMDSLYRRLNQCLGGRYNAAIHAGHRRYFLDWAAEHLRRGDSMLAHAALDYAKRYSPAKGAAEWIETTLLATKLMMARTGEAGLRR